MEYIIIIAAAVISYLIGSVNFSIILSKALSGKDIRESGSGNAGATNMLRTHGTKMAVITLILDVLKGIAAVIVGRIAGGENLAYIAAVCVVLGHNFPIFFGFKGGKGVATSLGVILILDWKAGLCVAVVSIIIIALTRYVSLGSIVGGIVFIFTEIIKSAGTGDWNTIRLICVIILGGLIVIRHRENIQRLINGTENKLSFKK